MSGTTPIKQRELEHILREAAADTTATCRGRQKRPDAGPLRSMSRPTTGWERP